MSFYQTKSPLKNGTGSASLVCHPLEASSQLQGIPTVFIVDGDHAACASLAILVTRAGWRAETFASAEDFLARPVELTPGCLILDVFLPGLSGLELQKRAAITCSHIPTIFLSTNGDVPTTVEAMKGGAREFLTKPFRDSELLSALREALERSRIAVAKKAEKQAILSCYGSLSLRQKQVMALVASGLLNKQVGEELGISEITVKAHRGQLMQKMQANSLADLVKMAGRLGLASSETVMLHDHVDRAACPGGLLIEGYAYVA